MKWIIPDALAPIALSQTLGQALLNSGARQSERMAKLFDAYDAEVTPFHASTHGCTSAEWLELQTLGIDKHVANLPAGAYLAALHAGITQNNQRVWLAQACGTVITPDRAMLVGLADLQATDHDLLELHHSLEQAIPLQEAPIQLALIRPGLWRITADFPENAWLASPAAVQGQDLGDWWPTEPHWKSWRKFLNETQMLWHNHPVNEQRETQGLPAISGLWLYGGGHGWTPLPTQDSTWIDDLQVPATQGDWQRWLSQYANVVEKLIDQTQDDPDAELILSGPERIATLKKKSPSLLSRLVPGSFRKMWSTAGSHPSKPTSWSHWWNHV